MGKRVAIIIFLVLSIDQIIKIWIKTSFYPGEELPLLGDWFKLYYIENPGMAFGTTFGDSGWSKLLLSLFRILAVIGIAYYLRKLILEKAHKGLIVAIALVWAGAFGNIIDGAFYDFIFDPVCEFDCKVRDPHLASMEDTYCSEQQYAKCRTRGFLHGNVVDMFQFDMTWPQWVPWLGGREVFPAIFNFADASITAGVLLILIRHKVFFRKEDEEESEKVKEDENSKKDASDPDHKENI